MKTNKNNIADTFNATYADIVDDAKLIQEQLKNNISFIKKLGKKAEKLYDYGNKKCYFDDMDGLRPIPVPGIKNLNYKMDLLDQLTGLYIEIKDLVEAFDMEVHPIR